ncbi:hypothetical protein [Limnohabitans sp. 2KL-3]|uniref:hypothetical protein n=1 Tax=Limnohabitans sp. 2KL-3 TaxID=1100700 RepID=UPI000A7D10AC|nr:hypothetical protein [Limnohabitans sp. 2KL-3]
MTSLAVDRRSASIGVGVAGGGLVQALRTGIRRRHILSYPSRHSIHPQHIHPAGQGLLPLWGAEVEVRLDHMLDESKALHDEMSNKLLASQEAMGGRVGPEGLNMQVMDDDPAVHNWLDEKNPWMDRQGWLTHDLLAHNRGHHPRFGVAALLQTNTVWVEVHTVRSYVFDLRAGALISPETK